MYNTVLLAEVEQYVNCLRVLTGGFDEWLKPQRFIFRYHETSLADFDYWLSGVTNSDTSQEHHSEFG